MQILDDLDRIVLRWQFGPEARISFYEELAPLMEGGVLLSDALKLMYDVETDDGRRTKSAKAAMLQECYRAVAGGFPLSRALGSWVSPEEWSLVASGEKSGRLIDDHEGAGAFTQAIRLITAKQQVSAAIATATVYPLILGCLLVFLLHMVSSELVPKLSRTTNPETWEGAAALLYGMSQFVMHYGALVLAVVIGSIVAVVASMPTLRGGLRVHLDNIPPWSVYRMMNGATFLVSVSSMLRAGIKLQDALNLLKGSANPWLRERIEATINGISVGKNFGQALRDAGYEFPDRKSVKKLVTLSSLQGFDKSIEQWSHRWMDTSIKRIQATAKALLLLGVVLVGVIMLMIIAGVGGIQDAIQAGVR